jgi:hypothetical protein
VKLVQINTCGTSPVDACTLIMLDQEVDWLMRDDATGDLYRFRQEGLVFLFERISGGDALAALARATESEI